MNPGIDMLTRFDTEQILAQLFWERRELDRQIAELESAAPQSSRVDGPPVTVMCVHCKRVHNPADDRWRRSEPLAPPPNLVSHGLCPECLQRHYSDWL